jgi:hypothetical protein
MTGIKGQAVGVVDVLVSGQPPEHRLPEQPVKPMDRVLPRRVSRNACQGQIGQPERVIELAHHQQAAVRTDLRARNSSRTRRSKSTRSARCEPAPSG